MITAADVRKMKPALVINDEMGFALVAMLVNKGVLTEAELQELMGQTEACDKCFHAKSECICAKQ